MLIADRFFFLRDIYLVRVRHSWIGIGWHYMPTPLFGIVKVNRKMGTQKAYGFNFLGFNLYVYIEREWTEKEWKKLADKA